MQLPSTLAWLVDEAGAAPGADQFLATLGAKLIGDGLPFAGGAVTLTAAHPIIARRTWLWRAETGAVIEALGFGSMGSAGPGGGTEKAKSAATGSLRSAPGWCWRMLPALQQIIRQIVRCSHGRFPRPLAESESALLQQVARFAAAPLANLSARSTLAALLEAYLGRRGAAQVLAGRSRRETGETIRAVLLVADLRGFTELSESSHRRRSSQRSTPGSTASPAPFMRLAARC